MRTKLQGAWRTFTETCKNTANTWLKVHAGLDIQNPSKSQFSLHSIPFGSGQIPK